MRTMTASEARQNFGQFLDYGIQEPVVLKRQKRELGVFVPMALYRRLVAQQNQRMVRAFDAAQTETATKGLSEAALDGILAEENPS